MTWTMTQDLGAFEAAAGGFLRARPVAHTVLLSATASLGRLGADAYGDDAPRYGAWRRADGTVAGAFLWTPPRAVLLSPMPDDAAAALADALTRERCAVPGVNAVRAAAEAFAAAWRRRHGGTVATAARHRLHRLGELTPPTPRAARCGQGRHRGRPRGAARLVRGLRRGDRCFATPARACGRRPDRARSLHAVGGRRAARLAGRSHPHGVRRGPYRPRLHPARAARTWLCRGGHGRRVGCRAALRRDGTAAVHGPRQPHQQRPLPAPRIPAVRDHLVLEFRDA